MTSMGECPCCKTRNLNYGALELENESCFFPWTCLTCGAEGLERYTLEYDCQELTKEGTLTPSQEKEEKIRALLEDFNNEVYNHDEMWQVERHNEGNGNHHYEFCCYKILRDGNLSPTKYEFQEREYIYSDEEMVKRLEQPFKS